MFYTDAAALRGSSVTLTGAEGRHAAAVRRLRPGEQVSVGDGCGLVASCVVVGATNNGLELAIKARRFVPRPSPSVTVIQAIPKGDRGELAVEEMTEVGVDRIVPWTAARSVPTWRDGGDGRDGGGGRGERGGGGGRGVARWRAKAYESAKQSLRAWIPEVTEPAGTGEAARLVAEAATAVLLDPAAALPLADCPVPADGDLVLVIGPEGGIAPAEAEAFAAAGAIGCRLGPTVLRTSTAGAVTAAIMLSRSPRWR